MWLYKQSTGELRDKDHHLVATGYAGGAAGTRPDAVNNPEMQNQEGVGPLPQGDYTFGQPIDHSRLGPYAIPLLPAPTNTMYGRRGFYMHGDTPEMDHSASDGCIIMPHVIRMMCYTSADHDLQVVA